MLFQDITNYGCIYGLCLEVINCGNQLDLIVQLINFEFCASGKINKQIRMCYKNE